jgi:membrane protease subunit HflK
MAPLGPSLGGRQKQPFDPIDWAARHPEKVFKLAWLAIIVVILVWGGLTAFYTVEANEQAVVLRFGKFHDVAGPGFHGKLPFGIDQIYKGEVKRIHREEFGYRTLKAGVQSQYDFTSPGVMAEATMLTGDQNIALVNWEVRYRIRDLRDYLFQVQAPVETLRDVSQAVMCTVVGDRSIDEILTEGRVEVENEVAEKMQEALDGFRCGIQIIRVNLGAANPPDQVKDAFDQVIQAEQARERIINEAEGQKNQKIPAARGEKERVIKEAEGYAIAIKNRAEGETKAFLAILEQYKNAKEVTRRRLYLEAMEKLLPRVKEVIVIDGEGDGVLKHLDLGDREGR